MQKKADFDRTVRMLFSMGTRWTWTEQVDSLQILRIIRGGIAQDTLLDFLKSPSVEDKLTLGPS
jgi:hypothetical protein